MTDAKAPQIVALVLSHNAPQSLARCVAAIGTQKATWRSVEDPMAS